MDGRINNLVGLIVGASGFLCLPVPVLQATAVLINRPGRDTVQGKRDS